MAIVPDAFIASICCCRAMASWRGSVFVLGKNPAGRGAEAGPGIDAGAEFETGEGFDGGLTAG